MLLLPPQMLLSPPQIVDLATPGKRPPSSGGKRPPSAGSSSERSAASASGASSTTTASGEGVARPRTLAAAFAGALTPSAGGGRSRILRQAGGEGGSPRQGRRSAEASDSEASDYSARLPSEWQPLEYELLEYASALPPGFASRIGRELEVHEARVVRLRALNELLLRQEAAAATAGAAAAATSGATAGCAAAEDSAAVKTGAAEAATGGDSRAVAVPESSAEAASFLLAAAAESRRTLELAASARELEARIMQVRREAERSKRELEVRSRAAEERQRQLAREAAEDAGDRKHLWEAEADLLRLRCKLQQKDAGRRHSERRCASREDEDRQLECDVAKLREEAQSYRARVAEIEAMNLDVREEDLRQVLKTAKAELRRRLRAVAEAPQPAAAKDCRSPPAPGFRSPRVVPPIASRPSAAAGPAAAAPVAGQAAPGLRSPRGTVPVTSPRGVAAGKRQPAASFKAKTSPRDKMSPSKMSPRLPG